MKLRTLCAVAVLDGVTSLVRADPVVLDSAQMDAVTAGDGNPYAIADANADAIGRYAFTGTFSNDFPRRNTAPRPQRF